MKVLIVLAAFAVTLVLSEKVSYDNYKVYRVFPNTIEQVNFLRHLEQTDTQLDFWTYVKNNGQHVDIMVPPQKIGEFEKQLDFQKIHFQININDVQKLLDKVDVGTRRDKTYGWDTFYNVEETYAWLRSLATSHADKAKVFSIGKSYERRDILAIKISTGGTKKAVLLDGGIHAREWSSVSTATYLINELLNSQDPQIQNLANSYDWYIIPILNPDGYEYSHTTERFWRKTRQPYGECFGADPNRNYDYEWLGTGQGAEPCLTQYAGPKPFSEPETQAHADFARSIGKNLKVYLTLHSYGQVLMYPYAYTWKDAENVKDYELISDAAVKALSKRFGTEYKHGSIFSTMSAAFGSSIDWMFGDQNVPLTFVYELRDRDDLDPKEIIPCAQEIIDSLISLFQTASDLGYFKN